MYGLSFGIMDVEDAHKGAELRIALQRETRVCYPIGAVAGAFAAVAARTAAGPKVPATLSAPKAGSRASSGRATQGASSLRAPGRGYPGTASDGPTNFTAVDCVGAVELRGGLDDDEELRYLVAEDDL